MARTKNDKVVEMSDLKNDLPDLTLNLFTSSSYNGHLSIIPHINGGVGNGCEREDEHDGFLGRIEICQKLSRYRYDKLTTIHMNSRFRVRALVVWRF